MEQLRHGALACSSHAETLRVEVQDYQTPIPWPLMHGKSEDLAWEAGQEKIGENPARLTPKAGMQWHVKMQHAHET